MTAYVVFLAFLSLGLCAIFIYALAGPLNLGDWYKPSKWFK